MKLISELIESPLEIIEEAVGDNKNFYLVGPAAVAEQENKNKRRYPSHILEREIGRYLKEHISAGTAWGELSHPSGASINPERISHRFVNVNRKGNIWEGKALVVNTPMGNIVRGLVESGGRLGFSTRGLGSLKAATNGINEVADDYHLVTLADIVTEPSGPGCFVNGIMEGVEFFFNGDRLEERAEQAKKEIQKAHRLTEEKKLEIFSNFMRKLNS